MNGFFNINKPGGMSSGAVVSKLRRLTGCRDAGHMGTLDPMATGVLPIAVGKSTRLFDLLLSKIKTYRAEFTFGAKSDTLDTEGHVVYEGIIPDEKQIRAVLPDFLGICDQIPPAYSAKKINGKKAYQLARAQIEFELKPKRVQIYDIIYLGAVRPETHFFEISCSAGTYIRSIARDLGIRLGTNAIMSGLTRTKSGEFLLSESRTLEEIAQNPAACLINPEFVLKALQRIEIPDGQYTKLSNGVALKIEHVVNKPGEGETDINTDYIVYCKNELFGIGRINGDGVLKINVWLKEN